MYLSVRGQIRAVDPRCDVLLYGHGHGGKGVDALLVPIHRMFGESILEEVIFMLVVQRANTHVSAKRRQFDFLYGVAKSARYCWRLQKLYRFKLRNDTRHLPVDDGT